MDVKALKKKVAYSAIAMLFLFLYIIALLVTTMLYLHWF